MTEASYPIDLEEGTLKRFNLSKQPFGKPESREEYFVSPSLKMLTHAVFQQLENEHYLIQVIKGEHGSGKSCLNEIIVADAPSNFIITSINANYQLTTGNILYDVINTSDHTSSQDTQQLAVDAANKIFRLLRNKQQPVLIIDDAHELTQKTLRKTIKFAMAIGHEGFGNLKLVLIGERDLEASLEKLYDNVLPANKVHNTLLRPFNRQDIEAYIRLRFKSARSNRKMPLSKKGLEEVLQNCGGLPSKINYLVCELLDKETQYSHSFSNLRKTVPVILLIAVLGIMLYYFLPARTSQPKSDPEPTIAATTEMTQSQTDEEAKTEEPIVIDDSPIQLLGQSPAPETITTGEEQAAITQSPATGTTIDNAAPETITASEEQAAVTQSPASSVEPSADEQITETGNLATIVNIENSVSWLLQQPSEHYMLQLAGTWNVEFLYAFAQSLKLNTGGYLVLHETVRSDRPWHILLYGPYPGSDAAKLAVESLPKSLQADRPWPRSIGSILKTL